MDSYFLEWTAKSQTTPITSFKLEYRIDDGDRSFLENRMQKSYYGYTTVSLFLMKELDIPLFHVEQ